MDRKWEVELRSIQDQQVPPKEHPRPFLRSLSMSKNIAQSIQQQHQFANTMATRSVTTPTTPTKLKKSHSTSSLLAGSPSNKLLNSEDSNVSKRVADGSSADREESQFVEGERLPPTAPRRNDMLTAIVVSRWDNIVGPQCVYLWTEERSSKVNPCMLERSLEGVVKYVTEHCVDHHHLFDTAPLRPSTQRLSLCVVPDLKLVYISLLIRVPRQEALHSDIEMSHAGDGRRMDRPASMVPHALAILANLDYLTYFLLLRPVLVAWLNEFAPKVALLLSKDELEDQSSMINSWCAELCKTLTALKRCWLQGPLTESNKAAAIPRTGKSVSSSMHPPIIEKAHKEPRVKASREDCNFVRLKSEDNYRELKKDNCFGQVSLDVDYLPPNLEKKSQLALLLTSHLSTFSSSIILGSDNILVNQVIRFLLCFTSAQEGYCSKYCLPSLPDTFMKGLIIQGMLKGGIGARSISYNQAISNRYPLTYVEVGPGFKVKRTNPLTHRHFRIALLIQELKALWTGSGFLSPPEDPFAEDVKEAAGMIEDLIQDLLLLPPEMRYARILLFKKFLHSKVIALIHYVNSIRGTRERGALARQIGNTLCLDPQELVIVQVAAEKLRPGVMRLLSRLTHSP